MVYGANVGLIIIIAGLYSPIRAPRLNGVSFWTMIELVGLLPSKICPERERGREGDVC